MMNCYGAVSDKHRGGGRHEYFVNAAVPPKARMIADTSFPPELARGVAVLILADDILPIESRYGRRSHPDAFANRFRVEHHVVRIEPANPVSGRPLELVLACSGEILVPSEVVYVLGVFARDFARVVLR